MGKKDQVKWDLHNISGCKINNLMIDVGRTIEELELQKVPESFKFILKGVYSDIHDLRTEVGNTVSSCIKRWEELEQETKND